MADNILDRFDAIIEDDKKVSDGKKVRICKKCKKVID